MEKDYYMLQQWHVRIPPKWKNLNDDAINREAFVDYLTYNGIQNIYHTTSIDNLESIRKNGIYSKEYLHGKEIKFTPGGNDTSFRRDVQRGFQGCVHTSFCPRHPMFNKYLHKRKMVTFTIDVSVINYNQSNVIFTNMNAAHHCCSFGPYFGDLKNVCLWATQNEYRKNENPLLFTLMQAEVLLEHIPPKFIKEYHKFS